MPLISKMSNLPINYYKKPNTHHFRFTPEKEQDVHVSCFSRFHRIILPQEENQIGKTLPIRHIITIRMISQTVHLLQINEKRGRGQNPSH